MDDPFDTWEHVAHDGSHTWSEEPYPGSNDDSVLHRAAFSGDIARLGLSIAGLDDVDITNDYGLTPLHLAVRGNHPEAIRILLLAGADPCLTCAMDGTRYLMSVVESAASLGCCDALIAMADCGLEVTKGALHQAAEQGHADCVLAILERIPQVYLHGEQLQYSVGHALQYAAANHHQRIVEILLTAVSGYPYKPHALDKGALTSSILYLLADTDMQDGCKRVYSSDSSMTMPILDLLVSAGAEVDSRAFWAAANHPKWGDIVLFLLEHGLHVHDMRYWNQFNCCEPDEFEIENESQPMILKVVKDTNEDTSVLTAFLAAGASVEARDKDRNSPLHLAASAPASRLLLEHGADLHVLNAAGQTPLHTACLHNHLDVARSLVWHGADVDSIAQDRCVVGISRPTIFSISSDSNDDTFLLEAFIAAGASTTARDDRRNTPLHVAAHPSFVDVLIQKGADMHAVNDQGQTPLYTACLYQRLDVARSLILHGAEVRSITNDQHWLSLMSKVTADRSWPCGWDIWNPDPDQYCIFPKLLAEFLLGHGANVQAAARDGSTALHMAAAKANTALLVFLLAHGADIGARNSAGQTALHYACACLPIDGHWSENPQNTTTLSVHCIQELLDRGVEINAEDNLGVTPLHGLLRRHLHGSDTCNRKCLKLLLERGADLDAKAHGDAHSIRSYIDQSEGWRINEIGLLEAVPAKPAHARSHPSMRGRGRGRGRGYCSTWT